MKKKKMVPIQFPANIEEMLENWESCADENVGWCLLCDGPIRSAEDPEQQHSQLPGGSQSGIPSQVTLKVGGYEQIAAAPDGEGLPAQVWRVMESRRGEPHPAGTSPDLTPRRGVRRVTPGNRKSGRTGASPKRGKPVNT
jgi:hypothetical protein